MDVVYCLNHLVPGANYGGCIEYERPDGNGAFVALTLEDVKRQYENLRWEDSRIKPAWEALVEFEAENPIPLLVESIAAGLEAKFLAMVPAHQGQPYFTPDVILRIMQTKAAVDAAIKIDPTGTFAMAAISAVQLPAEMEDSRTALLNDLSQLLGG